MKKLVKLLDDCNRRWPEVLTTDSDGNEHTVTELRRIQGRAQRLQNESDLFTPKDLAAEIRALSHNLTNLH